MLNLFLVIAALNATLSDEMWLHVNEMPFQVRSIGRKQEAVRHSGSDSHIPEAVSAKGSPGKNPCSLPRLPTHLHSACNLIVF